MKYDITEIGRRLKETREYLDVSPQEMADKLRISQTEYLAAESTPDALSLSTLYECAEVLGVELVELLTGEQPRLSKFSLVKNGEGFPMKRREGFSYQHLAHLFTHKKIEPLKVVSPALQDAETKPLHMSSHDGQEWDYILTGKLRFAIGEEENLREVVLEPGDSVYYDSKNPHGMVAIGGEACEFLAVLI
ncbi:MAG: XRE family transcriptional regulator [Oscillospiraceae bacterium]|jgi:transcriptional regulator with XRE-family HTH domain|nr:XRE family transcriptional regulator [Oscillospiraceae bacterium]